MCCILTKLLLLLIILIQPAELARADEAQRRLALASAAVSWAVT
jgi:hypothetical protein